MAIESKLLGRLAYFSGLSHDELESVKKYIAFEKKVEKHETVLSDGDPSDYMYFIISGVVKVCQRSCDGREQILAIASNGETVGDVAVIDNSPNTVNFLAMTPLHLYAVRKIDLEAIMIEYPLVARNALKVMASRVHLDTALVGELSFDKVINRLAKLIVKQAAQSIDMLPCLTQEDLASMVGTSRVVINRSLRIMEERGAIRLQRRRIVIVDEVALKKLMSNAL
jgi:CRP/FNR family cyclic AMP-dependent transcriptional regulator